MPSLFSKKLSGAAKKIFSRKETVICRVIEYPKHSKSIRENSENSESYIWRQKIQLLCREFDEELENARI